MTQRKLSPFGVTPLVLTIASAALLSACNGSGSSSKSDGTASFSVTDAPVDNVSAVKVTFSRIDLKPAKEGADIVDIQFDEPVTIDNLLELTGNASAPILDDTRVPAGDYNWIRLYVEGGFPHSTVTPELGNETDLFIPGQQNGNSNGQARFLQLNSGFTVAAGGNSDFTIDFVLRKGLTKPANQDYYLLRPAMRLLNNLEVGTISGSVASNVLNHPSCVSQEGNGAVYLYEGDLSGDSSAAEDYFDSDDATGARPIASADVAQNSDGSFGFTLGFVEASEQAYSVAYTCEATQDNPESDDDIDFTEVLAVTVNAGETSTVNFTQEPALVTSP
ncbi:DUF4382 domain-containing protein [Spongiibacter sp.]|uniref:DUF4382 domain-containing protein n=1 Tax=Spongiibacter sp. TaxID=2024860 RepID=UPI00356183EA